MGKCSKQLVLKKVTASFVKVAEPELKMSGQGREYSIQIIMPKDHPQVKELQQAIMGIAGEAFPDVQLPADCRLIRDSDAEGKGAQYEYMKDTWFFNLRRNEKQGKVPCAMPDGALFDPDPQTLFSGCLINVHIGLFDYSVFQPGTNKIMRRGVSGSINGIQLVDNVNVERLGGSAPVPEFEALDESDVAVAVSKPAATAEAPVATDDAAPVTADDEDLPW